MNDDPTHRTVIVAAVDGSASTDDVIRCAVATARGFVGGELHFVHIAEPPLCGEIPVFDTDVLVAEGERILADAGQKAAHRFFGRIEGHIAVAIAAQGILQLASELRADLIVVGSHGKSALRRVLLGSVSNAVLDRAHCAVLVARNAEYPSAAAVVAEQTA